MRLSAIVEKHKDLQAVIVYELKDDIRYEVHIKSKSKSYSRKYVTLDIDIEPSNKTNPKEHNSTTLCTFYNFDTFYLNLYTLKFVICPNCEHKVYL